MKNSGPLGSTPLEEEERKGLIPEHITTREELNAAEFTNINEAPTLSIFRVNFPLKKFPLRSNG